MLSNFWTTRASTITLWVLVSAPNCNHFGRQSKEKNILVTKITVNDTNLANWFLAVKSQAVFFISCIHDLCLHYSEVIMFYFLYNSYLSLFPQLSGLKAFEMPLHVPSNFIVIIKWPFSLFQSLHVILHKCPSLFFWPAIFYVWQPIYAFKLQKGFLEKKLSSEHKE